MGNAEKQTKQKIMEFAKEHFSRYGYAGTNLEAIGKEAGVTRGPLYYYFKNKKELYAAVIEQEKIRVVDQYKQIFEQPCSIYEKLEWGWRSGRTENPHAGLFAESVSDQGRSAQAGCG